MEILLREPGIRLVEISSGQTCDQPPFRIIQLSFRFIWQKTVAYGAQCQNLETIEELKLRSGFPLHPLDITG